MILGIQQRDLLQISGTIESDPRPVYVIEKALLGSYYQSDKRFGSTAEIISACNSLYELC